MKNKKREEKRKMNENKAIAFFQIFVMVVATIAFSWMVGGGIKTVSAADESCGIGGRCTDQNLCATANRISGSCDGTQVCCKNENLVSCTGTCVDQNLCATANRISGSCGGTQVCCGSPDGGDDKGDGIDVGDIFTGISIVDLAINTGQKAAKLFNKGVGEAANAGTTSGFSAGPGADIPAGPTSSSPGPLGSQPGTTGYVGEGPAKPSFSDYFRLGRGTGFSQVVSNFAWGAVTVMIVTAIAKKYSSERNAGDIQIAALIGLGAGVLTAAVWSAGAQITTMVTSIAGAASAAGPPGWLAAAVVLLATAIYMVVGYQVYSQEVFTYRVKLWQPPVGGDECSKCNSLMIGKTGENACSEYICHSYGSACEWINTNTDYETCIEANPNDHSPPVIEPVKNIYGEEVFPNEEYDYRTSVAGARIIYNGEGGGTEGGYCVPAYTPITLAFKTEQEAECRISLVQKAGAMNGEEFEKMKSLMEGDVKTLNHTLKLPSSVIPSSTALDYSGYELANNGIYRFYIRCIDNQGNINAEDYTIQFCVQSGPDYTSPEVLGTNPVEDSYIKYGVGFIEDFQVYTTEPADCRWDTERKSYTNMAHEFEECSQNWEDRLVGFEYGCQTNLTNFRDGMENKYYIACLDQPELKGKGTPKENERNVGAPKEITLKGTRRLTIQGVSINGKQNNSLITGPEEYMKVEVKVATFGGAEDGKSKCLYGETQGGTFSLFTNDHSREYLKENVQAFNMPSGDYKYFIRCYDVADNSNITFINFSVRVDTSSPIVVRAFREDDYLKIITDEVSECVYSKLNCLYEVEKGQMMSTSDGKEHSIDWDTQSDFYIKCKDEFNNYPADGDCSIVARPFEIYSAE